MPVKATSSPRRSRVMSLGITGLADFEWGRDVNLHERGTHTPMAVADSRAGRFIRTDGTDNC